MEEFRPVVGFTGYRVGDRGTVQSCRLQRSRTKLTDHWRDLKRVPWGRYWAVSLTSPEGESGLHAVHHLVLEAFVGPRPEGQECRHLDDDPANNVLGNLAWGTRLENMADRKRRGGFRHTIGSGNSRAKLDESDAIRIREMIADGVAKKAIAGRFGVSLSTVYGISYGDRWTHLASA